MVGIKEVRNNNELSSSFDHPLEAVFGILHPLRAELERTDQNVSAEALWHGGNSDMIGKKA